jgi:hypothetical protein
MSSRVAVQPRETRPLRPGTRSRRKPVTIATPRLARYFYYGLVAIVILSFAVIRFRLRDMPLERDEGEYAYAGQLILQGIPPYRLAYNMKLPGTYAAYAVILAVFGQTPAGIHCGVLLLNAATILMMYLLGSRLFGLRTGALAATTYAVLSASPSVLGLAGHATHFVVAAALAGILLLLKAISTRDKRTVFASGVMFGLAFLMKQPGVFFIVFGAFYLVRSRWKQLREANTIQEFGLFSLGVCLPFAVSCVVLFHAGVFHEFWFWTFAYGRQYGLEQSISDGIQNFLDTAPAVIGPSFPLWILAGLGITSPLWSRKASNSAFLLALSACSFCAVIPGLYFREHYFILLLPAVSILGAVAVDRMTVELERLPARRLLTILPVTAFAGCCLYFLIGQRAFLFETDPITACRTMYGVNPFPEAQKLGEYLASRMSSGDTLAVLGSEPEIYFYSRKHSATGYIYMYGLMEDQPYASYMQKQMIREVEDHHPKFVLYVDVPTSWLAQPNSIQESSLRAWAGQYVPENYELTGVVDLLGQETQYIWGHPAKTYQPRSPYTVQVFKLKEGMSSQDQNPGSRLGSD